MTVVAVVKGTFRDTKKPVWLWADKIIAVTQNNEGKANVWLLGSSKCWELDDVPEEVFKTIARAMQGVVQS